MVEVRIRKDSRERLSSFLATGHAGWADHGSDVVCASVSTLLQAAWLGLNEVAGVEVTGSRSGGRLELAWPEASRDDAAVKAVVATAARSIERLAAQYPANVRAICETER